MKVIICGCGNVGSSIASYLFKEGHQVTLIDADVEKLKKIEDEMDVQTITGQASSPEILKTAGASDADLIIAVTHSDEVNMIICFEAAKLFNVPLRIARVRSGFYANQGYVPLFNDLHIDVVISPEKEIARTILRNIKTPGALEFVNMQGNAVFIGTKCVAGCDLEKKSVGKIERSFDEYAAYVAGIIRDGARLDVDQKTILKAGDEIYFVSDVGHYENILAALGQQTGKADHIVIVGGGRVGYSLAKLMELEDMASHLTLIEQDDEKSVALAAELSKTLVIKGDAMDEDILHEAGIDKADAFVSLTGEDEDNILLSLLTKRHGVKRTFALINKQIYNNMLSHLGVDVIVNPNAISTSTILQHIRKGQVQTIYSLKPQLGDLMAFEVLETSKIAGQALSKLKKKKQMRICGVVRDGAVVKLSDDFQIQSGDSVIILAPCGHFKEVEKLFAAGLFFF